MRDSRISTFTQTTLNASTTSVTGPTISLLDGYAYVNHKEGTSLYGIGVECMAKSASIGNDADGFTLTWKWQVSADDSTWVDGPTIGVMAYDETNGWTKDGALTGSALGLTRAKLSTRLRTTKAYARLVCTAGSLTGTATVVVNAWVSDGTHPFSDSGIVY